LIHVRAAGATLAQIIETLPWHGRRKVARAIAASTAMPWTTTARPALVLKITQGDGNLDL